MSYTDGPSESDAQGASLDRQEVGAIGPTIKILYLGIAANYHDNGKVQLALVFHDATYLVDTLEKEVDLDGNCGTNRPGSVDKVANVVIDALEEYEHANYVKVIGAGVSTILRENSPRLCPRLWFELDVVPVIIPQEQLKHTTCFWDISTVDEQAESLARMCMMHFGPTGAPLIKIGRRGSVLHDHIQLGALEDYERSCSSETWRTMTKYASSLRDRKTRVAFFSATPQGGGVAIMRHALVRLSNLLDVDLSWYIPKPRASAFLVTKKIHNTLQGESDLNQRVHKEETHQVFDWILENANRYWFPAGGPLSSPEEGGADIIFVDDPQLAPVVALIKDKAPGRPVVYRSHIQIRSDLIDQTDSPQAEAWSLLWDKIHRADYFISHPVPSFVPKDVPREKLVYVPGSTDLLDGLNKKLNKWDQQYYGHLYNVHCLDNHRTQLDWPNRKYFIQVSRFDPAKDIPTVIDSYGEFRRLCEEQQIEERPQLVVCGNGSSDDPDASRICAQVMSQVRTQYSHLADDISVMSMDPNDQLLNFLLANAHVVLQLSTAEGFEVKLTEAQHAGRPVIATDVGGIALQVKDEETGFFVRPGDAKDVARRLMQLTTDQDLWQRMSKAAANNVQDEATAVGNALCVYYLATKLAQGDVVKGDGQWLSDLALEDAGYPRRHGDT